MHTVDFMETYSPTPKALCVKTVVAVTVEREWELRQLDVKQAFIQADMDYDVFRKPFYYLIPSLVAIGRGILSLSFMINPLLSESDLYFCLRYYLILKAI